MNPQKGEAAVASSRENVTTRTVWRFYWRDREIHHPLAKAAVGIVGVLSASVGMVAAVFGMVVIVPLAVVLHIPLRLLGRRGTIRIDAESFVMTVDREAVRRA